MLSKNLVLLTLIQVRQRVCEHGKNFGCLTPVSYSQKQTLQVINSSLSFVDNAVAILYVKCK